MYDVEIAPEQRERAEVRERERKERVEARRESERVRLEQEQKEKRERVEASEKAAAKRDFISRNPNATDEDFERLWPQIRDQRMLGKGSRSRSGVPIFYKSNF